MVSSAALDPHGHQCMSIQSPQSNDEIKPGARGHVGRGPVQTADMSYIARA